MQQEYFSLNVALLAKHAGTSAAELRARIRVEQFTALREGIREALSIPLLPERPRKRSQDAPDDLAVEVLADRLHNERVVFARSQANAQLGIGSPQSSKKVFTNLLQKVGEAAKCLVNRHAKMVATNYRAANKKEAEDATAAKAVRQPPATPT